MISGQLAQVVLDVFFAIAEFCRFYMLLLIFRIYLGWFPNINLYKRPFRLIGLATDPYLRIFRGLVPQIANIDLSPIIGFVLMQFIIEFFTGFKITN